MNRRRFIQSLVSVLALPAAPALSFRSAAAVAPVAAAVPAHARSWAVYMSVLHGECTPQALKSLLNIPEADATRYVAQLIAEGALKPNPLLQKSVTEFLKPDSERFLDKVKQRLQLKENSGQSAQERLVTSETNCENDDFNSEAEASEDLHEGPREDLLQGEHEYSVVRTAGEEMQQV